MHFLVNVWITLKEVVVRKECRKGASMWEMLGVHSLSPADPTDEPISFGA